METGAPRFWGYLLISSLTPGLSSDPPEEGAWSSRASMTSQEARVIFSKEKLLPTGPSQGHPFLHRQRQVWVELTGPDSLACGLALLPGCTASACPSDHMPPAGCFPVPAYPPLYLSG